MPARRPGRIIPRTVTRRVAARPLSVEKSLPAGLTGNLAGGVRDMAAQVAVATQQQLQHLGEQTPMPRDTFPYAFGPGTPLYPSPLDPVRADTGRAEPRIYEYPVSWNLPGTSTRLVPWQVLRRASNIGVIRDCIRIRKNEIVSLKWDISVSQDAVEAAQRDAPGKSRADIEQDLQARLAPERARITAFWKKPDKGNGYDFGAWMMQALEEHLVLDALAIYPRYTLGGDLYSLEVLDGSTIKPLLDNRGGRPLPPYPAYQQILYGFPRGEYTADTDTDDDGTQLTGGYDADQLIYLRREVRTFSPYGLSAVEQSLTDVDLWMKRMAWMRAEYTDGVMPAGWMKNDGSSGWTPQQTLEYERFFNDIYAGQTDERQRFRMLPPGVEPVEGRNGADEKYKPDYDLHLLKLVVAHFDMSIAELGFTEAKGLGSSGYHEGQEAAQQRKGTRPDLEWMAGIISDISRTHLAMPAELEFKWLGLDQEDEASADTLNRARVDGAGMTLNEWRDELGRPRYSFPEADMPMIVSSRGGIVFLDGASKLEPAGVVIQPPTKAPDAPGEPGDKLEADDEQDTEDGEETAPAAAGAAKEAEKAAYRRFTAKGPRAREFQWKHHTPAEVAALTKAGGGGPKARTGQTWAGWTKDEETAAYWAVRLSRDLRGATDTQALADAWATARGLAKSTTDDRSNPANIADARIWLSTQGVPPALRNVLTEVLHGIWTDGHYVGDRSAVWVLRDAIVSTAEATGVALPVQAAGHAAAGLKIDWAGWTPGDTDAARALLDGGLDRLLEQAGVTINSVLAGRLDALAEILADGITGGLAPDTIARGLDEVLADSKWASLVAETETSRAINFATQGRYLNAGITANTWMTAADQRVCPACMENEDAGPVSIGQSFPSGASGPPGHPRCRCALAPDVQSIADIAWPTLADELNPTGAAS
ncbi:minor capsid protein [Amycolatopsis vancoresmycina]|uniref:Phage head morphogenesis protein n=1 Tax=Amycolatopsis vancoresmycina DSM 44592 TaxID=1292037 RepID=R1G617_9PSEU|nr:minor capsid protein [Amycolatopsis vancoresmycina]EOD66897.1 phage head morphogenesis protein [Amycolatopsis vancoresmycina DSM 44592]